MDPLPIPIAMSRALSVEVQSGSKALTRKKPNRARKMSSDYSDWIESYRKWR